MRRIALTLSTLIVSGAVLFGTLAAQETSVFRYASDPFSEEAPSGETEAGEATDQEEPVSADPSYNSYESWPTGGKNLVQRKAIYRAQQRELRIASRQWYGFSASRPPVYGNPYYVSAYSPTLWGSPAVGPINSNGPFGWYYPRQSISSYRWAPSTYAYIR